MNRKKIATVTKKEESENQIYVVYVAKPTLVLAHWKLTWEHIQVTSMNILKIEQKFEILLNRWKTLPMPWLQEKFLPSC